MTTITMPDFHKWGYIVTSDVIHRYESAGVTNNTYVIDALQQAFNQGRALGRREAIEQSGYEDWMSQEPNILPLSDEDRATLIKEGK